MRTVVVQLQNDDRMRFRAGHLFYSEGVLELVAWDSTASDNRTVAVFPLAEIRWAYVEDTLADGGSDQLNPG